jgi:tetratricopeptide (TPR) repeat protein
MTRGCKGQTAVAGNPMPWVLLLSVLIVLGGCAGTNAPAPPVDRTAAAAPADATEAQLLAQVNTKFENPQAHYELARLYHKSQNWTKAEYEYHTALSFEPQNKAAQAGLVKLFVDRGEKAKAEQYANAYIRQSDIAVAETLRLGWEFEQLGLSDYALRAYRQAVTAAPDSADANKQLGLYYLHHGDNANAKDYLKRSFDLNPRQPDVAGELGRLGVVVETPGIPEGPLEQKSQ